MPKKLSFLSIYIFIIFILLTAYCLLLTASKTYAQLPTGAPTCDLCGWCNPNINPKPADWDQCYSCLYDASGNPQSGNYYTVFGCLSTKPGNFVKSMISIFFGIAGGVAFLAVLAGSAVILTSSGDPQRLRTGKDIVTSSIIGILIIIFSVFLLKTVGVDILKIPGFG